ncbi:peptide chain release factor N(5)-glutamine methyltransferase [Propionicimonas sp.]|uniref:peptide chain release factor N(5)-glutamine methyltransferase n=1 Tax=Propionicimonas sp. TaxID=1955623 RepID=UPI0039E44E7C
MATVPVLLADGTRRLRAPAEARTLLAHALGVEPARLALVHEVPPDAAGAYAALVERRAAGEPVQYLTGRAWFRTVEVGVGPGVFIPRPETELMTGWAIDRLAALPGDPVVVELCAGSGAISAAIAAERPGCRQYAVELSPIAARVAEQNLAGSGVALVEGDMAEALGELDGTVDLVIANPPYIPLEAWEQVAVDVRTHEPEVALFSGADGLDALRVVARVAKRLLRPGGFVCAEHAEVQGGSVVDVFAAAGGYSQVADHPDLNDRPRYVTAVRAGKLAG